MGDGLISRRAVAGFMIQNRYCTSVDDALDQLESVPTAYDVDEVVGRIEAMRIFDCKMCDKDDESSMVCVYDCTEELIDLVIEIVREGVRMDDRNHDREH